MKQPRRLTRAQKILLSELGIDHKGFRLVQDEPDRLILTHEATGRTVTIAK